MESNFEFLSGTFPDIYAAALEAEQTAYLKPVSSGMHCRQAMELLVNYVYKIDGDYELPYENKISAKLNTDYFRRDVSPIIQKGLHLIRKVGNNANHNAKATQREADRCVKYLYSWAQYVFRVYVNDLDLKVFNDDCIPKVDQRAELRRELAQLRETLEKERVDQEQQRKKLAESEEAQAALKKLQAEAAKVKEKNKHLPIPAPAVSEAETRQLFIDADLKAAGWDLEAENVREYKLDGFPSNINPTGTGFVDYVLWGEDGLPLAVVEAKRTCEDVKKGKTQAKIYTDCLEAKFGQRPIIIYTNGFEIQFWDDLFATPRQVFGYYTKAELQRLINRRNARKDLRKYSPKLEIANRYYQKEAIQRINEAFVLEHEGILKQNRRRALAVMATGTGKTRTAIALVEIMMKASWVKKVLFLADRNALVTQAKKSFTSLLPNLTSVNLSKEREGTETRLVFSTYQTMINRIDSTSDSDLNHYGVGHFDLIIVDEAHRSIYNKYQDIFHYFDGLIVGLTATPREEADRDTYEFFNCEEQNPTYYYELDQAVKDGYLVPPKKIVLPTKFLQRGIRYDELSEAEKEKYEMAFASYGEEPPEEVTSAAINKWLFNKDTVVKILHTLMMEGQKVQSGDVLGKTIIFAVSQKHAEFIEEVFNEQYPEYSGHFAQVITYKDKYAQDSIDRFKEKDRKPVIAISVDMLDTGIDVPEILNLVFFKPVYAKTKFWQMIGRGTRLCENLFGPGEHKQDFYVFDCCDNFAYFNEHTEGRSSSQTKSISHRIFEIRLLLAEALRNHTEEEAEAYRKTLLELTHQEVLQLYEQRATKFAVRMRLALIEQFSRIEAFQDLTTSHVQQITDEIGPIVFLEDADEKAKLFDNLLYQMEYFWATENAAFERGKVNLKGRARRLESKSHLNVIKPKLELLRRIQQDGFWDEITLPSLEFIRTELRALMKLLETEEQSIVYTDIKDELLREAIVEDIDLPQTPQNYLDRVKSYIRQNKNQLIIRKIGQNIPITSAELIQLESILFDGDQRGTKQQFEQALGEEQPLMLFIRSIIGLDKNAALEAFSEFLDKGSLTADQQQFIHCIIEHFENNGFIDPAQLYEMPYNEIHMNGLDGVFTNNEDAKQIMTIIRGINDGARKVAG